MHPNPVYRRESGERNLAFARERAFGVLSVNGDEAPLISHIPFLLDEAGGVAEFHLVRSNPIVRLDDARAVIAVTGPDGYVSPDWYGIEDQVPTWNYIAIHLRGRLTRRPQEEMRDLLVRQSAFYEARLAPKPAWKLDKVTPEALDKLMRMIVPYRLEIESVDGTWKLSQNKADAVRLAAADRLEDGFGAELALLAGTMRSA